MKNIAIYAITKHGAKLGAKLKHQLPFADLYVSDVAINDHNEAKALQLPLSSFIDTHFSHYDGHIFICATGIVLRTIAPLIEDKRKDPAVVCLDEQGTFAISLLSGHRGGANELAHRVAHITRATPVVTTASDVSENISADMMGAQFGWFLDPISEPAITPVSAAIVNQESVVIAQQAGEKDWWPFDKRLPRNLLCHDRLDDIDSTHFKGAIVVSDLKQLDLNKWKSKAVLWRPKSLILGIGCDRGTPLTTLVAGLEAFSQEFNLSLNSIKAFASIDLKADEVGLLALSNQYQWPFTTFAPAQLDNIKGIESPSDYVKKVTGSNSVAEAAALKLSGQEQLLVRKWVFKKDGFNMTIACCRMSFSESLVKQKRKNWLGEKKHGSEDIHPVTLKAKPVKRNLYGNEVVEGYQCKPKHVDLNRPMLFHTHHLLLCEGGRCAKAGAKNLAHDLRGILKDIGLASGKKRIKISRSMCVGACRNRSALAIYQRLVPNGNEPLTNHGIWLRGIEAFSEANWRDLFHALATNQPISEIIEPKYFAPFEEPTE